MNIAITGCTGTVGSVLTDLLLKECKPAKVALFCRDDQNLPT
jgi:nucleoside-diphosphate-sugar epimerase